MAPPLENVVAPSTPKMGDEKSTTTTRPKVVQYTAFGATQRWIILGLVTAAGFLGPLAGNIYLPALPVLSLEFQVGVTEINATVTAFMAVFAFGVSDQTQSQAFMQPC
jgi:hypothetical protein